MDKSDITIIVITRYWPTALSVIRSLGSAGYTVDLVSSMSEKGASVCASSSRYVRNSLETVCKSVKQNDDPGLLDAILSLRSSAPSGSKPVLFPTDDYTASFIDRNRDRLKDHFLMPYAGDGAPGRITALMNKVVQSNLASASGLLCPREWTVPLYESVIIPEDMVYPCFVKPLDSVTGFKGEMAKCDSREELSRHLEHLRHRDPNRQILIQQFLEITNEIDLSGISIIKEDGSPEVIIPAIIRKSYVASYERGVTAAGVIHPAEELGTETLEGIKTLLINSGYRGIFDLEINIAYGKMWFGELNLRSGGPNYAYYLSGINLPELVVKDLLGLPISEDEKRVAQYGISFIYEKVLWKEYMTGRINRSELNEMIRKADFGFIENSDDPVPYRLFRKKTAEELRSRAIRKIKRRLRRLVSPFRRQ